MFSVCVYCGSKPGNDPAFTAAARALGTEIGRRGWRLVYGGASVGLMGEVADATLAAGADVVGVIPYGLFEAEVAHNGLHDLRTVSSMHERKKVMADEADAFVALPGGFGTFEELFEMITWRQLRIHNKPIGVLDVGGYYTRLLDFLDGAVDAGLVWPEHRALLTSDDDPAALLDVLAVTAGPKGTPNR